MTPEAHTSQRAGHKQANAKTKLTCAGRGVGIGGGSIKAAAAFTHVGSLLAGSAVGWTHGAGNGAGNRLEVAHRTGCKNTKRHRSSKYVPAVEP